MNDEIIDAANSLYRSVMSDRSNAKNVLLHIADDYTILIKGEQNPDNVWILPIGRRKTSDAYFKSAPPTPAQIENAIMRVEDEIMPISQFIDSENYELISSDPLIKDVLFYAGLDNKEELVLPIKEMESVFYRLAAILTGRPASMDILPSSNEFASALLILREVMHHLKFKTIKYKHLL